MRKLLSILLLLLLISGTVMAEPSMEDTLQYFEEIVFGKRYPSFYQEDAPLRRLNDPIRVCLIGNAKSEDALYVNYILTELERRLNLDVSLVYNVRNSNVNIYFSDVTNLPLLVHNYESGKTEFWSKWNGNNINLVEIGVDSSQTAEKRKALILYNLFRAMGMKFSSDTYTNSLFHYTVQSTTEPSELDWKCIELFYSPKVKPGMTFQEIKQAVSGSK